MIWVQGRLVLIVPSVLILQLVSVVSSWSRRVGSWSIGMGEWSLCVGDWSLGACDFMRRHMIVNIVLSGDRGRRHALSKSRRVMVEQIVVLFSLSCACQECKNKIRLHLWKETD